MALDKFWEEFNRITYTESSNLQELINEMEKIGSVKIPGVDFEAAKEQIKKIYMRDANWFFMT